MSEGRYLYGIIKTNEIKSFGPCGINADEEVYTVTHEDIACVVSNSPIRDYSSMLKETLGQLLVRHQTIIEKIMKGHAIIPVKFGTNLPDDDEIRQVLIRGYSQFKELLSTMDSKIEFDVVCIWNDLNSIIKEIGEEDSQIKEFKEVLAKKPASENLQDRIKIGMMIKDALDKRKGKERSYIIASLKEITVDFQKHQVMDDKMILNCAFLLEKAKEPYFDARLKELDKKYNQKVNFRCVGPLPPYSFATCQLRKVGYSQIDEAKRLLGLRGDISLEGIKASYYQLAQKNHPDKNPGDAPCKQRFEEMTHAYKLLTNCFQGEGVSIPLSPRLRRTGEDKKKTDFIVVEVIKP
ncbi:MAG: GvpL/GvpF family gas vesicle protein [Candidatus Omnitrophica bacterium]|nr:GvpL/GvpF family gas vesicle protein [Candidatus Omnitrophota bacterium]